MTFVKHALGTVAIVFVALALVNKIPALAPVKSLISG